ncbi:MAG: hypothetical protein B6U94_08075 [Thermofilum sp. ex4484_79]|nr:MAG: hypothetical protein B6U94_08075 [Thermofilum sp. ex4484_79]
MSLNVERRERFTFYKLSNGEKEKVLREILDFLKDVNDILLIVLFGSFVKDKSFRDIDIGIYVKGVHDFLNYKFMLEGKLEKITGYPIDIKILNYAPPWFVKRMLEEGVIVYEKIEGLSVKIYKKALDEMYLDKN